MAYKSRLEFIIVGNSKQEVEATNSLKSKSRERNNACVPTAQFTFSIIQLGPPTKEWY